MLYGSLCNALRISKQHGPYNSMGKDMNVAPSKGALAYVRVELVSCYDILTKVSFLQCLVCCTIQTKNSVSALGSKCVCPSKTPKLGVRTGDAYVLDVCWKVT